MAGVTLQLLYPPTQHVEVAMTSHSAGQVGRLLFYCYSFPCTECPNARLSNFAMWFSIRFSLIVIPDEGRNPETGWLRSYLVQHKSHIPVHVTPFPVYPSLHMQVKLPTVFMHIAFVSSQLSVITVHSSISTKY